MPLLFFPEVHADSLEFAAKTALAEKDEDGNGKLSFSEFWGSELADADDGEEYNRDSDFKVLDADSDGELDLEEFKVWESRKFHAIQAMHQMLEIADKDKSDHLSADELDNAKDDIWATDAHYYLKEWVEHAEL